MNERKAELERKSKETEIKASLNIDGTGAAQIKTHIGLLDHMLELFAFHGNFDLALDVKKADFEIDIHHTNEDVGIVLGKIFKNAVVNRPRSRMSSIDEAASSAIADKSWSFPLLSLTLSRATVEAKGACRWKRRFEVSLSAGK